MRKLMGVALAALTAVSTMSFTSTPADAHRRGGAIIGGLIAGALIGGLAHRHYYRPYYSYGTPYYSYGYATPYRWHRHRHHHHHHHHHRHHRHW